MCEREKERERGEREREKERIVLDLSLPQQQPAGIDVLVVDSLPGALGSSALAQSMGVRPLNCSNCP